MLRFIKIVLLFVLGLAVGLSLAAPANASDCVPQDATETTYKDVPNPEYIPGYPAWTEEIVVRTKSWVDHQITEQTFYPAGSWVPPQTENYVHKEKKHLEREYQNPETGELAWVHHLYSWRYEQAGWTKTANTRWIVDQTFSVEVITIKDGYTTDKDVLIPEGNIGDIYTVEIPEKFEYKEWPEVRAIGEPTIRVVDVEGKPAVVCSEVINVSTPVKPAPVGTAPELAATGPNDFSPALAGIGLGFLVLGIFAVVVSRKKGKDA